MHGMAKHVETWHCTTSLDVIFIAAARSIAAGGNSFRTFDSAGICLQLQRLATPCSTVPLNSTTCSVGRV